MKRPTAKDLQAGMITRKYGLPDQTARLIAALYFGEVAA